MDEGGIEREPDTTDNNFVAKSCYDDLVEKARLRLLDVHTLWRGKQRSTELPGSFERFFGLFRGFAVVLLHHGAPFAVVLTAGENVMQYLCTDDEALFFKRAKWLVAYPMARFLRNPLPATPKGETTSEGFKMTGCFRRWSNPRFVRYSRKNQHLWFSWFQCKRAALAISDTLGLMAQFDHRKNMERDDPADDELVDAVVAILEPLLCDINDLLVSSEKRWSKYHTHSASLSSSLGSTRKKGGQMGKLATDLGFTPVDDLFTTDLVAMREIHSSKFIEGRSVSTQEIRSSIDMREKWTERVRETARVAAIDAMIDTPLEAEIALVFEPLKIRVISKGHAAVYYSAVEFQKELHQILRRMPCFRAIGRPISVTDIPDVYDPREAPRNPSDLDERVLFSAD
ncbi:RNA-dependent RNA polymerase [viral metagenome]|uniref:RNA-dependent RNA polymerase n=1 Tax=viral metagenome TaxID=1070528 RepID=A0A6L2ZKJ0_9ZZZZ